MGRHADDGQLVPAPAVELVDGPRDLEARGPRQADVHQHAIAALLRATQPLERGSAVARHLHPMAQGLEVALTNDAVDLVVLDHQQLERRQLDAARR